MLLINPNSTTASNTNKRGSGLTGRSLFYLSRKIIRQPRSLLKRGDRFFVSLPHCLELDSRGSFSKVDFAIINDERLIFEGRQEFSNSDESISLIVNQSKNLKKLK
jgi:hypothetical protein